MYTFASSGIVSISISCLVPCQVKVELHFSSGIDVPIDLTVRRLPIAFVRSYCHGHDAYIIGYVLHDIL